MQISHRLVETRLDPAPTLSDVSDCAARPGGCGCRSNPSVGHKSRVESSNNGLARNRENGQDARSSGDRLRMCLWMGRWRPDLFAKRTGSPPEAEAGDARQRPPTSRLREVHPSCTSGDSRSRFRNCRPIDVSRPRCRKRRADPVQCEPDDGGSSLGMNAW